MPNLVTLMHDNSFHPHAYNDDDIVNKNLGRSHNYHGGLSTKNNVRVHYLAEDSPMRVVRDDPAHEPFSSKCKCSSCRLAKHLAGDKLKYR